VHTQHRAADIDAAAIGDPICVAADNRAIGALEADEGVVGRQVDAVGAALVVANINEQLAPIGGVGVGSVDLLDEGKPGELSI